MQNLFKYHVFQFWAVADEISYRLLSFPNFPVTSPSLAIAF